MGKKDLLKFANEKKPAEFSQEFKSQIDAAVQKKLNPEPEVEIEDDDDDKGEDED